MKKFLVTLLVLGCMTGATFAQNTFKKGDKVINLGIGFGSTLYTGSYYTTRLLRFQDHLKLG